MTPNLSSFFSTVPVNLSNAKHRSVFTVSHAVFSWPSYSRPMPVEVLFSLMLVSLTRLTSMNMFITNCANPPLLYDRGADILRALVCFLSLDFIRLTLRSTDQCEALVPSPSSISFSLDEPSNP